MNKISTQRVAEVFGAYPRGLRRRLLALRKLIIETAKRTKGVGELEETLRWNEPSYLTSETKSGSIIRIDQKRSRPGYYAMYFHCQTNLIETFRELFPKDFEFEGNRAILFRDDERIPEKKLSVCISMALTYNLKRK